MSELDFIYKRKSIRDYKDAVIPKEDILKMLDAATHAPSPKHQQNWLPGIFNDFFGNEWIAKTSSAAPAINIVETEKEYEVQIAAPGITKDDFDITVDKENHLVVTVEHKQEEGEKDKKGRYLRREFSYSQFQQTLILPDNVNTDAIEAHQNNGVLTVMIPKKQTPMMAEKKKIMVK